MKSMPPSRPRSRRARVRRRALWQGSRTRASPRRGCMTTPPKSPSPSARNSQPAMRSRMGAKFGLLPAASAPPIRTGCWSPPPAKPSDGRGVRVLILIALLLAGCTAPAPPLGLHLIRVGFNDLPGWQSGDPAPALAAFRRGCAALTKKSPEQPMAYAGTAGDWQAACAAASEPARSFFQSQFTPYAVSGEALFTGYFEPEISASRTRHDAYQTPVYGLPSDLISVDLGQFLPKLQ